jgi:Protein of unknown function (DUF3489)
MTKCRTNKAMGSGRIKPVAQTARGGEGKVEGAPIVRNNKLLTIIALLRRPGGATITDLADATGWKPNSVRGTISGAIQKRRLMKVVTEVANGVRTYRITG